MIKLETTKRGPLFDGRVDHAIDDGLKQGRHEVATRGVTEVRQQLDKVLKHPTGYYRRHIAERHAGLADVVHDSGVVYGPWLAGSGSRNRTTRFKGYTHWRRAVQALRHRAGAVAGKLIAERLRRL